MDIGPAWITVVIVIAQALDVAGIPCFAYTCPGRHKPVHAFSQNRETCGRRAPFAVFAAHFDARRASRAQMNYQEIVLRG
jgi:hypothetical protein